MKAKKTTQTATINKYTITPADRIEIMWKQISKGRDNWDFYDIKYGEVIITDCRVVEGKNGDFLAMPSKEKNGEWYPLVYLSRALSNRLLEYIEQADEADDWLEVQNNEILTFTEINSDSNTGSNTPARKKRNNSNNTD